jgi:hypothetical protein
MGLPDHTDVAWAKRENRSLSGKGGATVVRRPLLSLLLLMTGRKSMATHGDVPVFHSVATYLNFGNC